MLFWLGFPTYSADRRVVQIQMVIVFQFQGPRLIRPTFAKNEKSTTKLVLMTLVPLTPAVSWDLMCIWSL